MLPRKIVSFATQLSPTLSHIDGRTPRYKYRVYAERRESKHEGRTMMMMAPNSHQDEEGQPALFFLC